MYKGKNILFIYFVKIFFKLKGRTYTEGSPQFLGKSWSRRIFGPSWLLCCEPDVLNSRIGLGILCEQELMM